jgi:hypothetical protein
VHKVPLNKVHASQEAFPCIKREGTVVYVKALEYFVGTEDLGAEHFGSVATQEVFLNLVIGSSHDSDNFTFLMFPIELQSFRKRSHKEKE